MCLSPSFSCPHVNKNSPVPCATFPRSHISSSNCISPTSQPNRTWGMGPGLNASGLLPALRCSNNIPSTTCVTFYTCPFLPRICPRTQNYRITGTQQGEGRAGFPHALDTPRPADLPACRAVAQVRERTPRLRQSYRRTHHGSQVFGPKKFRINMNIKLGTKMGSNGHCRRRWVSLM